MKTSHPSHASDFVVDYAVVAGPGLGAASSQGHPYFSQGGPSLSLNYSQSHQSQRQRQRSYAAAADVDIKPTIDQVSIGIGCDIKPIVYLDADTQQTRQRSVIIKQQNHHQTQQQQQHSLNKSGAAGSSSSKRKREKGEFSYSNYSYRLVEFFKKGFRGRLCLVLVREMF